MARIRNGQAAAQGTLNIVTIGPVGSGKTEFTKAICTSGNLTPDAKAKIFWSQNNKNLIKSLKKYPGSTQRTYTMPGSLLQKDSSRFTCRTIVNNVINTDNPGGYFHALLEAGGTPTTEMIRAYTDTSILLLFPVHALLQRCAYYNPLLCNSVQHVKECEHYADSICKHSSCAERKQHGCSSCRRFNPNNCLLFQRANMRNGLLSMKKLIKGANARLYIVITHAALVGTNELAAAAAFLKEQIDDVFQGERRPEFFFVDSVAAIKGERKWQRATLRPFLALLYDFLAKAPCVNEGNWLQGFIYGKNKDTNDDAKNAIARQLNFSADNHLL